MGGQSYNPEIQKPRPDLNMKIAGDANRELYAGVQSESNLLGMAQQLKPIYQEFNPSEVSQRAFEQGVENQNRVTQFQEKVSPGIGLMKAGIEEQVQELTSPQNWQIKLNQWAKSKGLANAMQTGIDPYSTMGKAAIYDASTAQGRQFALENLGIRQKYLEANQMQGGIDPGALIAGEQAAKASNFQGMQDWQRGLLAGAQGLGQTTQSAINRSIGNIQNAHQANVADTQNYNNMVNEIKAKNAQSKNSAMGSWITAGGAVGGAALGAAIIV